MKKKYPDGDHDELPNEDVEEFSEDNFISKQHDLDELQLKFRIESKKENSNKSKEQKRDEHKQLKEKEWKIIKYIEVYLLTFACIDYICQIIGQMPIINFGANEQLMEIIGFRKVWNYNNGEAFDYKAMIIANNFKGMNINEKNLYLQMLNCAMICVISLQTSIFASYGYKKFISQKGGSMDLLCELADMKAKSPAFVYNNAKIRKIYSIQHKKEVMNATVEKLKEKIVRWRKFTKTTLDTSKHVPNVFDDK